MSTNLLALFAKAPKLGRVKTRLCPPLSESEALTLHRALVADSLSRFETFRLGYADCDTEVVWSAPPDEQTAATVPSSWGVSYQVGSDLGARMGGFVESNLRGNSDRRVLILGSDSPTVPLPWIGHAFDRLGDNNVVLGPATDGGYYLVAASRFIPEMFTGIDWGSERVLNQTQSALNAAGASYHLLDSWSDVDRPADLASLKNQVVAARTHNLKAYPQLASFFEL